MAKTQPPEFEIETEVDGMKYTGSYSVKSRVVTTRYRFWSKSTQVGNSSAERMARLLLGELVIEHKDDRP